MRQPIEAQWSAHGVDLTAICKAAGWHLATAIDAAKTAGVPDPESFIRFVFADRAGERTPEITYLTDAQWEALR